MTDMTDWTRDHAAQMRNHWWWRPGWGIGKRFYTWHITFDGHTNLHRLVSAHQQTLAEEPGLDPVPLEWLHLTMQGIGFTHDIEPTDVDRVVERARARLAQLQPVEVTFTGPIIRPEAIALVTQPVDAVQRIRAEVRIAIADALGADRVPEDATVFQPHVTLAYSNTDQPSARIAEALARVSSPPTRARLSSAALIELNRDSRMYQWQTITTCNIGP